MPSHTKQVVRKIYTYKALVDFILLYPLYVILFEHHGLSVYQISTLLIIWAATDLVTNVPTGVLADRFSRRKLLSLAPLVEALGFLVWFLWPTYIGFALGFVLWGVGGAIFDGTYESLLYDELKKAGIEKQYVKIAGRAQSFALLANFAATILAGAAILLGFGFVIWGSIGALVVAACLAMTLPEAKQYETAADTTYFSMLRQGINESLHNQTLLGVIMLGSLIGTVYGCLEEYVPLFFKQVGYNNTAVTLLVGLTVLMAASGSFMAHRYEHVKTTTLIFLFGISGVLLFSAGTLMGIRSTLLLVAYTFLIKALGTLFDGKVQHAISGNLRATITSVSLFTIEVLSIATYLLYGLLSRHGGNFAAFRFIGIGVGLIAVCYLLIAPNVLHKLSRSA